MTITRGGMVKKSLVSDLPGPSAQTFKLVNVNDGDSLGWVVLTDGTKELLLATSRGMAIRFAEQEVRPMGLLAAGVNGIKLGVGDVVIGAQVLPVKGEIFIVASDGKAKRVEEKDFPVQGRYGKVVPPDHVMRKVAVFDVHQVIAGTNFQDDVSVKARIIHRDLIVARRRVAG